MNRIRPTPELGHRRPDRRRRRRRRKQRQRRRHRPGHHRARVRRHASHHHAHLQSSRRKHAARARHHAHADARIQRRQGRAERHLRSRHERGAADDGGLLSRQAVDGLRAEWAGGDAGAGRARRLRRRGRVLAPELLHQLVRRALRPVLRRSSARSAASTPRPRGWRGRGRASPRASRACGSRNVLPPERRS